MGRDQSTSSTLIGGKGRAGGPSLIHTMLEGPMEYISECKMDVKSTWIPISVVLYHYIIQHSQTIPCIIV